MSESDLVARTGGNRHQEAVARRIAELRTARADQTYEGRVAFAHLCRVHSESVIPALLTDATEKQWRVKIARELEAVRADADWTVRSVFDECIGIAMFGIASVVATNEPGEYKRIEELGTWNRWAGVISPRSAYEATHYREVLIGPWIPIPAVTDSTKERNEDERD